MRTHTQITANYIDIYMPLHRFISITHLSLNFDQPSLAKWKKTLFTPQPPHVIPPILQGNVQSAIYFPVTWNYHQPFLELSQKISTNCSYNIILNYSHYIGNIMKELKHNQKVPKDIRETLTQNLAEIQGKFSLVLNNPSGKQGLTCNVFWVSGLETTE